MAHEAFPFKVFFKVVSMVTRHFPPHPDVRGDTSVPKDHSTTE